MYWKAAAAFPLGGLGAGVEDTRVSGAADDWDDDVSNEAAFSRAEEHCFRTGEWDRLTTLYRRRLAEDAVEADPAAVVALRFRLGQILEERAGDLDAAIAAYWAVARIEPGHGGALRQLRRIHTGREDWKTVDELAALELGAELAPHERVAVRVELGRIQHKALNDLPAAETNFEQALAIDGNQIDALTGLARLRADQQRPAEAARLWEQIVEQQRGPDRALALISLGELLAGPLGERERAVECFERALADDPRSIRAVEPLIADASQHEQWPVLDDLYERQFNLAGPACERAETALAASRNQLEHLGNPAAARLWLERARQNQADALELAGTAAAIERRAGNRDGLLEALEQLLAIAPELSLRLEIADLWSESGDDERALDHLREATRAAPDDPEAAAALDHCLHRLHRESERVEWLEHRVALSDSGQDRARRLGEIARLQGETLDDPEAALDAWRHCFQADPQHEEAARELTARLAKAEEWTELRGVLERACEEGHADSRTEWLCQLGELVLVRFDEPEAAARAFELTLELEPRSEFALRGLSQIAHSSGDDDAIVAAYQREAEGPTDKHRLAPLVWELVRIFDARDQPHAAIPWLQRLHECSPDDVACLEAMVVQFECADDESVAVRWAGALEALASLSAGVHRIEMWNRLSELEARVGNRQAAIRWAESSLAASPDQVGPARHLVTLYGAEQQHTDCARALRQLAHLLDETEREACLAQLAVVLHEELDDPDAAIEILQEIVSPAGGDPTLDDRLTELLEQTGRHEALAQHLLEQSQALGQATAEGRALALRRAQLLLAPLCRFEQAASAFQELHEADPTSPEALRGLEEALRAGRDAPALVRLLDDRAARADDPSDRRRLELERAVLLEEGVCETDDPRTIYQELAAQTDDEAVARQASLRLEQLLERVGAWQALRDHLDRSLARCGEAERVARLERLGALCRDRLSDPVGAIDSFEAAAALAPSRAPVWRTLAVLYEGDQRPDDLLRVVEAELACESEPTRELELRMRAAQLCKDRDPAAARSHCERVLELAPDHGEATETLVDLYTRADEPAKLVALLESMLNRVRAESSGPPASMDTREPQAALQLRIAAVYADELADLDAAIGMLEPACNDPANNRSLLAPLADLLQRAGRFESLIALCRTACAQESEAEDHTNWQRRLAHALESEHHGEEAAAAYETVLRATPDDAEARAALRSLYRSLDRSESLASLLVEQLRAPLDSADAQDDPAPVHAELADLYANRLGRRDDALTQLQQILAIDPSDRAARHQALELAEGHAPPAVHEQLLTLALDHEEAPRERGALLRRLAALAWRELADPRRAERTLEEALAIDPEDRAALRALQELCEATGNLSGALDLYEREGALPADDDPERTIDAWLYAGAIARDTTHEPERALAAYDSAAAIGRLSAAHEHEWALLLEACGQHDRQALVLGQWCDREDSGSSFRDHLGLADQLAARGHSLEALERTRRATECDAAARPAWDALAERCGDATDLPAAAAALERAAALSSGRAACERYLAAALAIESHDPEQAMTWLEAAARADSDSAASFAQLARIAAHEHDLERAETAAHRALGLQSEAASAQQTGLDRDLLLEVTLVSGRCARHRGDLHAAAESFEAALGLEPEHRDALTEITAVLDALGTPAAARPWLERLLALDSRDGARSEHLAILAEACEAEGREAEALTHFEQALERDPELARAHAGRVRCFERAAKALEAVAALEGWAQISSSPEAALLHVRAAELERASDLVEAAQARLRRATELDPHCPAAWCELAELLSADNEDDAALEVIGRGLQADCEATLAARLETVQAGIFERTGRIPEAASAWAEVVRHDPSQSQAALEHARLLGVLGQWSAAAERLTGFALAHPDPGALELASVHDERARLLAGPAEDVPGAIEAYEQALAIDPARTDARARLAALLAAIPGRRAEAIAALSRLLRLEPTHGGARLALLALARGTGQREMVETGEAIASALAPSAAGEPESRPLALHLASPPRMDERGDEAIRRAVHELRPAFEALPGRTQPPASGLRASIANERAKLSARGLDGLTDGELAAALFGGAALALDPASPHAATPAARALGTVAQPRALRRARRQLGFRTLDEICRSDIGAWRAELSALATARLLDRGACSLRAALETLLDEHGQASDDEEFSRRIAACPAAHALLARVMARWCGRMDANLKGDG